MSVEVGNNGRERYAEKVDKVMYGAGFTKVLDKCCDKWELDNVYVRNDLRSSFFGKYEKPRLMNKKFNQYGQEISGTVWKLYINMLYLSNALERLKP